MEITYTGSSRLPANTIAEPPVGQSSMVNVGDTERALSVAGGAALTALSLRKFSALNFALGIAGGVLLFRGLTGICPLNSYFNRNSAKTKALSIDIETSAYSELPKAEVYNYWRALNNLPKFMRHLKRVQLLDQRHSWWEAEFPGSFGQISWEAEIIEEQYANRLAWRSLPGSTIDNSGEVVFREGENGSGTILDIRIRYRPPVGYVGKYLGNILNKSLKKMIEKDIARFSDAMKKEPMESFV